MREGGREGGVNGGKGWILGGCVAQGVRVL